MKDTDKTTRHGVYKDAEKRRAYKREQMRQRRAKQQESAPAPRPTEPPVAPPPAVAPDQSFRKDGHRNGSRAFLKPPRLFFHQKQRQWKIKFDGQQIPTGCGTDEAAAKEALARYVADPAKYLEWAEDRYTKRTERLALLEKLVGSGASPETIAEFDRKLHLTSGAARQARYRQRLGR